MSFTKLIFPLGSGRTRTTLWRYFNEESSIVFISGIYRIRKLNKVEFGHHYLLERGCAIIVPTDIAAVGYLFDVPQDEIDTLNFPELIEQFDKD